MQTRLLRERLQVRHERLPGIMYHLFSAQTPLHLNHHSSYSGLCTGSKRDDTLLDFFEDQN